MKIVVIDYGAGNTKSVQFALERCGVQSELTNDPGRINRADGVVFPGVGHASQAMKQLRRYGLDKIIPALKQPVLGICLGMQLMCSKTEEGDEYGLGIFETRVLKFNELLKVPQIGWNSMDFKEIRLFRGLGVSPYFYFVHSYYVTVNKWTVGTAEYGVTFSAVMQKNNFYACQFHPEKSGKDGETVLKNFIALCKSYQQ